MPFRTQHQGAQPLCHPVSPISLRFFAESNQLLICAGMQTQLAWLHKASLDKYATHVHLAIALFLDRIRSMSDTRGRILLQTWLNPQRLSRRSQSSSGFTVDVPHMCATGV